MSDVRNTVTAKVEYKTRLKIALNYVNRELLFPFHWLHIQMYRTGFTKFDKNCDWMCVEFLNFLATSLFRFCNTYSMHAQQTHTDTAIKITLSPQSLRALMAALYSLSINKIRPCAPFRALRGIRKQSATHGRIWYKLRETFTLHWKHRGQLKNRHVQQWKINEVALVGAPRRIWISQWFETGESGTMWSNKRVTTSCNSGLKRGSCCRNGRPAVITVA